MFFRGFLFLILALCISTTPLNAQEDTSAEPAPAEQQEKNLQARKEAAAQLYLENIDIEHSFENIYAALQERLPGEAGPAVILVMRQHVNMQNVRDMVKDTLKNHYTTEELEALAEFYSSDVGRSISRKLPAYLEDVNMNIQKEAERAFRIAVEELSKKAEEKAAREKAAMEEAAKQEDAGKSQPAKDETPEPQQKQETDDQAAAQKQADEKATDSKDFDAQQDQEKDAAAPEKSEKKQPKWKKGGEKQ